MSYPTSSDPKLSISRSSEGTKSTLSHHSKDVIKKNTSEVLRLLVELSTSLKPLPENRMISVKLLYTSSTPAEYEPPLFQAADEESVNCWFDNRPLRLSPGTVSTPHHEMSLCIRTLADVQNPRKALNTGVYLDAEMSPFADRNIQPMEQRQAMDKIKGEAIDNMEQDAETENVDIGDSPVNTCRAMPSKSIMESQAIERETEHYQVAHRTPSDALKANRSVNQEAASEVDAGAARTTDFNALQTRCSSRHRKTEAEGSSQLNHIVPDSNEKHRRTQRSERPKAKNLQSHHSNGVNDCSQSVRTPKTQNSNMRPELRPVSTLSQTPSSMRRAVRKVSEVSSPLQQRSKRRRELM